jgi:ParB family chromosome partitioning protein
MIAEVKIDKVYPNPNQPRKDFNYDKLEEMAMSIKEYGVLEPIVLTPRNGKYMIIAGERRFRASLLAGLKEIPARIIKADDALVEELALLENIQRQDLNCIEEAKAYKSLLDRGMTKEELASKLGFKQSWRIDEKVGLLNLLPEYQEMAVKNSLTPLQAYKVSLISPANQRIVVQKILSGELNTSNKLRSFVEAMQALERQDNIFELQPITDAEKQSIKGFNTLLTNVEGLIKEVYEQNKLNHFKKGGFRSEINPNRLDMIIKSLMDIRKAVSDGAGLKSAMKGEV